MDRRDDCTWMYRIWSPTKVWDCAHRYLEPLLFKVLKRRSTNTRFSLAGWSWAWNAIYTKPWRIYVFHQTKKFRSVVFLRFWNQHWCLVKIYTIIQMKALWCESFGFERKNNVLAIYPKSRARPVEASASVRWLLWTSWLVLWHTACKDSLVSCQGGQKSDTTKNHLSRGYPNSE